MMTTRTITITIRVSPKRVYDFVRDAQSFPKWISFIKEMRKRDDGESWTMVTDHGNSVLRFAPDNDLGVLDHVVTLESGQQVRIPARVVANEDEAGSELMFTVFRQKEMTDDAYEADVAAVEVDLKSLKKLLESS